MFKSSLGGGIAAPCSFHRHALVRLISGLLDPLKPGPAVRGWSALSVAIASVLMSLDAGPTLAQRFDSVLSVLDRALPRRRKAGRTYQGFVKALTRCSASLLGVILPALRARTLAVAAKSFRLAGGRGWVPIGVDGSRIDAPRTIANETLGFAGRDKCGPQMLLLLLFHLGAMLPWWFKVGGACESERTLLRSVLSQFPKDALLVMDAGFTGFELLSELCRRKLSFLVRVGNGVHLLKKPGSYQREGESTVYLWPDAHRDKPPLTLRLIRLGSTWLITDVTDSKDLPRSMASELYRRRWGVEVAFRSLKQTLERRKVRSCVAAHAWRELEWSVVGMWVLMLAGAAALRWAGVHPRELSVAAALSAARRAMRAGNEHGNNSLRRSLSVCVQDGRTDKAWGKGSKKAYQWAHKKNPGPPGCPRLTKATAAQVRAAKKLVANQHARS